MGSFLDSPITEKYNEHGEGNNLQYGLSSMQGWRMEMEDAHSVKTHLNNEDLSDWSYFAVFDGHAGSNVSTYSSENLLDTIINTDEFKSNNYEKGIHEGFLNFDNNMRNTLDKNNEKSGTTVVCAFISSTNIIIANCGDSRAVLCNSGKPIISTRDHKPILPDESERIKAAGGSVMVQRVNGSLAVSRALGDYEYKNVYERGQCEQLVSPEPEILIYDRDVDNDEFLILACDGIWDVMSNEDICDLVYSRLTLTDDLEDVANLVVDTCLYKGSRDNMSIVIVKFPAAPKPTVESLKREADLDMEIERRIKEIVEQQGDNEDFNYFQFLQAFVEQEIPNLPPGGGLSAKQNIIEKMFRELCPSKANTIAESPYANPYEVKLFKEFITKLRTLLNHKM